MEIDNEENFILKIEKGIETGDYNLIKSAINTYKNLISNTYIIMAEKIYHELICEKIEAINI